MDDEELERLKEKAEYFELDKTKDFEDFKGKYFKAVEEEDYLEYNNLYRKINRKEKNNGVFSNLKIPLQKRFVQKVAKKYGVDLSGITIKIQRSERLLSLNICGSTDYKNIGRIDLFPNAFVDEEQLIRTLIHEKVHVEQLKKYGFKYTQEHLNEMEKEAYSIEEYIFNELIKKVK